MADDCKEEDTGHVKTVQRDALQARDHHGPTALFVER